MDLLKEIIHCPNIRFCLENQDEDHPCRSIVEVQGSTSLSDHQVPEPWSGHIEIAPILFVSSNPSISETEQYPRWDWPEELIVDFFENRFGGGERLWVQDGIRTLENDGAYARATAFWAAVRQRAIELFERDVEPGEDYSLTELVHCKSKSELGVMDALEECSGRYLCRTLKHSGAVVIVALGSLAKRVLAQEYGLSESKLVHGPMQIEDKYRYVAFMPHPNARGIRTFEKLLSDRELERLRAVLV